MVGLHFTGEVVAVELPEAAGPDGRWPFGNVKLQGYKWDGEPYWFSVGFNPVDSRSGKPTVMSVDASHLVVGEWADVQVEAKVKARGDGVWFRGVSARMIDSPALSSANEALAGVGADSDEHPF